MAMAEGIELSECFVVFLTHNYLEKASGLGPRKTNDNCCLEFGHACRQRGVDKIISVIMEPSMRDTREWHGSVGARLGGKLYIDLSGDGEDFEAGVQRLAREIMEVTGRTEMPPTESDPSEASAAAEMAESVVSRASAPLKQTVVTRQGNDKLRKLLQPLSFEAELAECNDSFIEGTRQWILDDIERWRRDLSPRASRCRALLAPPGFGKTAVVGRFCASHPVEVLAVHLCRYNDARKREPQRMVRSLAYQVATKLPQYGAALVAEADELGSELDHLSVSALIDRLLLQPLAAISAPDFAAEGRALLVIDALDEAEHNQRNALLEVVRTDFGRLPRWIGLLVTSRPELPVQRALAALRPTKLDAECHTAACEADARLFLRAVLGPLMADAAELEAATDIAVSKAQGVFLYLHWLRERLLERGGASISLPEMDALPEGLGQEYSLQMRRLLPEGLVEGSDAMRVLRAIVAAASPPHAREQLPALSGVAPRACHEVVSLLSQLFPVRDDGRVYAFHKSLVDWLTASPPFDFRDAFEEHLIDCAAAHRQLALACVAALQPPLARQSSALRSDVAAVASMRRLSLDSGASSSHLLPVQMAAAEDYAWQWGVSHLLDSSEHDAAVDLLCSLSYLQHRVDAGQLSGLLADTQRAARHSKQAEVLDEALMLSRAGLASGAALAEQLWQRLVDVRHSVVTTDAMVALYEDVCEAAKAEKLHAIRPMLEPVDLARGSSRQWHTSIVTGLATATLADGEVRVISGSSDRTLRVWDIDGTVLAVLEGHTDEVTAVAATSLADGTVRVVSASADCSLRLWDLDGTLLGMLEGHSATVKAVTTSPLGVGADIIVSGSSDCTVRAWSNGKLLVTLEGHTDSVNAVATAALADGELRIVSGSADSTVRVWSASHPNGGALAKLDGHSKAVLSVATTKLADGSARIISGSEDYTIRIWDLEGAALATLQGHTDWVKTVAPMTLADGAVRIVSGSDDGRLAVWDLSTLTALRFLEGHVGGVWAVAPYQQPDGSLGVVSSSNDNTMRVWTTEGGAATAVWGKATNGERPWAALRDANGNRMYVNALKSGSFRVDNEGGAVLATLHGHTDWVRAVATATLLDGTVRLVSASFDHTLRVWSLRGGSALATLTGHKDAAYAVATASLADGAVLVLSGSLDHTLGLWDLSGERLATLEGHTDGVRAVATVMLPGGTLRAISGSADGTVCVWDPSGGAPLATLSHPSAVNAVTATTLTDGAVRVVSGSSDCLVRVWDLSSRVLLATLNGHTDGVWAVAMAQLADGTLRAFSVSGDGDRDMDADYLALLTELESARGNVEALLRLKAKFSSEHVVANHQAVLDLQRRWCRFREIIALHRPDVIAFQEMDMMRTAVDALTPLGYVCSRSGTAAVCSAEERDSEVPDSGDLEVDAAAYLQHVHRVGVSFAPKVGSVCRKLARQKGQPEADDDGVAIFWRDEAFELTQLDFRCLIDPKRECRLKGTVGVQLRRRVDGCPFSLLTAHITSGTDDKSEQMRIDEIHVPSMGVGGGGPSLLEAFAATAQSMATVLALDANSGPDRTKPDVWRAMRTAPGVSGSVWDEHWSTDGTSHAASCVVTSNKMRGPLSAQPKKIGEHIFQCCDLLFFSERLAMQRHVFEPLAFEDAMAGKRALLPTLDMPSDHSPVCVDLLLQPNAS